MAKTLGMGRRCTVCGVGEMQPTGEKQPTVSKGTFGGDSVQMKALYACSNPDCDNEEWIEVEPHEKGGQ